MAGVMDVDESETSKTISFGFAKKTKTKLDDSKKTKGFIKHEAADDERDWITAAEGKVLRSVNPKTKNGPLVIPMIKKNKWRLTEELTGEDSEAAKEIFEDLQNGIEEEKKANNFAIPLLMQNRLPTNGAATDADEDEMTRRDLSLRPDASTDEDYEAIPIAAFGAAMLRGMGWAEGKPIGLTNKGLCEPIEYIPRHKGLGLGAQKMTTEGKQRKRKPGDKVNPIKNEPIIDKDGRVRHVRRLGETGQVHEQRNAQGFHLGAFVTVTRGIHAELYAKVIALDEDNARVTIQLKNSLENVNISQHYLSLVDAATFQDEGKKEPQRDLDRSDSKKSRRDGTPTTSRDQISDPNKSRSQENWLMPDIRVRIVHRKFCNGRYYNKKVDIVDVVTPELCTCRTDDGKLIEDVKQKYLETVIPKGDAPVVMVVNGKYRSELCKIVEKDKKKCRAHVQLLRNQHITTIGYDDISEYIGTLPSNYFT